VSSRFSFRPQVSSTTQALQDRASLVAIAVHVRSLPHRSGCPVVRDWLSLPNGAATEKGKIMTVARITEISSVSGVSFQDAIVQGVERANKTLKNVKGAWVKDQEVTIDNGKITGYKVILKVTFILAD
jgi:flavin-binding protein dodecin